MSSVSIKNGELELFRKILKDGYVVENGMATKRIVRELNRAGIPIYHGSVRDAKKVIIAIESPLKIVQRRRTLAKTIFDVKI